MVFEVVISSYFGYQGYCCEYGHKEPNTNYENQCDFSCHFLEVVDGVCYVNILVNGDENDGVGRYGTEGNVRKREKSACHITERPGAIVFPNCVYWHHRYGDQEVYDGKVDDEPVGDLIAQSWRGADCHNG